MPTPRPSEIAPPEDRRRDLLKAIDLASEECLKKGITSFQDAGSPFGTLDMFRQLADEGKLKLRLWVMVRDDNARMEKKLAEYRTIGAGDDHLTIRAIKRAIDGAWARTARGSWNHTTTCPAVPD